MWEPQRRVLAGHDVVRPNLYRLGGNSIERWAERLLDEAADEVFAAGASMGGYVALAMARLAPERVHGLLLAGARPDADSPERRAGRADTIRLIEEEGPHGLWESMRPKLLADQASEDTAAFVHDMALAREPDELVRAVEAIRDRPDSTEVVRSFDGPVRFVLGEGDTFFPPQDAKALGFPLDVLQGSRHLPNLEQPEAFNQTLLELLQAAR
jgi:pimeloyl-ACP methyl ester carboxylesterase